MQPQPAPIALPTQGVTNQTTGRTRTKIVGHVLDYEQAHQSQRRFAQEQSLPRSTLQGWLKQKNQRHADPALVAFFETPTGVVFLHRLTVALHLVMSLMGASGIRRVCLFLEYAGLSSFIACSYEAQRKVAKQVEEQTVLFGQRERERLSQTMPPKTISVCQDETFHPTPCLVAIEPVSNFLLVEQYSERRDSESWSRALQAGLHGLRVEVIQGVSDEGQAILRHVETTLGVPHSPDLFHVQYEISRGTSAPLAAQVRPARASLDQASLFWQQVLQEQENAEAHPQRPGRPPDWGARIEAAERDVEHAQRHLQQTTTNQESMQQVVRDIGTVYHPYELQTGVARSEAEVKTQLGALFHKAPTLAHKAALPARCLARIGKAARVAPAMIATIAWFHTLVSQRVAALDATDPVKRLVNKLLLPALYLQRAARAAGDASTRAELQRAADRLLDVLRTASPTWQALPETTRCSLMAFAKECADLFQRSSSCVEGRNGQLALRHHQMHRISGSRLSALTVVHNYVLRRPDRTTAAERFFGAPPRDLFFDLLERIPLPARPRKRKEPSSRASAT